MDFKKDKRLLPCGAFSFFRRFPAIPRFSAEIAPADRPRKAVSAKKKAVNIGELPTVYSTSFFIRQKYQFLL